MSEIRVTPLEPAVFGVEIDEGGTTTGHRVVVPPTFWDDRGLYDVDDVVDVKESVHAAVGVSRSGGYAALTTTDCVGRSKPVLAP